MPERTLSVKAAPANPTIWQIIEAILSAALAVIQDLNSQNS